MNFGQERSLAAQRHCATWHDERFGVEERETSMLENPWPRLPQEKQREIIRSAPGEAHVRPSIAAGR